MEKPKDQVVNMLPSLDSYLMGYKDRERYLDREHYSYVFDRSGNATSTILLDGKVLGIWDVDQPFIKIFFFENLEGRVLRETYSKARSIGRFMTGKEIEVKECHSMVPLTQRTAGAIMSPLKDTA